MQLQWPLILFTTLASASAGLFATQAIASLRGIGGKVQARSLGVAVALLAVAGVAVFTHLQHWERIFNGFGHVSSGITQEFIAVIAVLALMVAYFATSRRSDDGRPPAAVAVLSLLASLVLVCVMGGSYLMASRPAWSSVLQVASLLGAACAFGPALFAGLYGTTAGVEAKAEGKPTADTGALGTMNLVGTAANALASAAYLAAMSAATQAFAQVGESFDTMHPTKRALDPSALSPFAPANVPLSMLALGALIAAVAVAVVAWRKKAGPAAGWLVAACTAVAVVCLRAVFYQAGASVFMYY